ncbi:diguanylate cyclase (GGDEF)-like protein [Planomicrobium soli]|uniref:Diguanylate cyclase (GGDEF)-like protein n=1 Tax=Planomicrobium soli TaxID=1176648 RepID=A0A2P8H1N9_9BACL|nr:GGDEF domain-containing protein [Planomicrobium soli]PSL40138.1 diguanylate cyclase (GGDEF)-like protein [Planomicrobium soli]
MTTHSISEDSLPHCTEKEKLFNEFLFEENMQRSKLFAKIVTLFEGILIFIHAFSNYAANQHITMDFYLFMYLFLFAISICMVVYITRFEKIETTTASQRQKFKRGLTGFVIFFLAWGAVVTLADQREYGNVMAFAVNFMCVSILYHASNKQILQLYALPVTILAVGLPFFQNAQPILFGHYINLTVFLFFCWLASRMLYRSNKMNFYNQLLLTATNENLAQTIEKNEEINRKLEATNERLRKLTLMDELTKISNRRGLQQYIDNALMVSKGRRRLSFIMLDIDNFKLFNDNYGHFEGDKVLQLVAQQINNCVDSSDCHISRFGGEEFIVAVFDQDLQEVVELAGCIQASLKEADIPHEYSLVADHVTVSIGIATGKVENSGQIQAVKEKADFALYEAKSQGKNRINVNNEKVGVNTNQ